MTAAHTSVYLMPQPRRPHTNPNDPLNSAWKTTSGGSTFLPSMSPQSTSPPQGGTSAAQSSSGGAGANTATPTSNAPPISQLSTYTSSFSTTITRPSTTFTSLAETIVTSSQSASTSLLPSTTLGQASISTQAVCIGDRLDASADGLLAAIILPSVIGLLLWLLFAIIRPRYRQVYALREWFVQQDLRPPPLRSTLWAFLFPPVPIVPSVPDDVSDAGRSPSRDAELFPSDEQLSQRTLWISFLIALGWTILGLGGALPLYLVSTPCLAQYPQSSFGGAYSTLQDLSLLRLLKLLDDGSVSSSQKAPNAVHARAIVNGSDASRNARIRLLVLTCLTLVLGLLPALWKIFREFNRVVAYRKRWIDVRCEGKELGWLSTREAPGFVGWGEKRLKDFIIKTGLSSSLESNGIRTRNGIENGNGIRRQQMDDGQFSRGEEANLDVDVQSLFSIGDTHALALLIDERDEILENLETAETRYIFSFRISTPDPSIADFQPPVPPPQSQRKPYISRPRALGPSASRRRRRANPAYAASSLAPTSFVAPSQYYKLRGVSGVSGGRFAESSHHQQPSLSDSIHSRVVGTRFKEVNRNSAYGRLPLGSHVALEKSGELGPILDPRYGPNHTLEDVDEHGILQSETAGDTDDAKDEWVDLMNETPIDFGEGTSLSASNAYTGEPEETAPRRRLRKVETPSTERRETFPRRNNTDGSSGDGEVPPHLRLQPHQPFVRPVSGLNHDDLGAVYGDISQWRSKLKSINAEIAETQRECYNDIADGTRIKGWLIVGRGLRFIPGIQLIEGRAKEDIRWDVLQHERRTFDRIVLWILMGIVTLLLALGLTAASGLALASAPDFAHYLPFLQPLAQRNNLVTGLATTLAPAVAATLFIAGAIFIVDWSEGVRGHVSLSVGQLSVFKSTFFILTAVATIWLITVGALLFALRAFSGKSEQSKSVANGSVYMSIVALTIIINVAIIFPALLLLQPVRLWRVMRSLKAAVTPRQRFRAIYPRTYNPSYATGACILAIIFASTFALIFPLIGPAVVVLLFLSLIAHRFLVGYVFARTHSQTGGLLQIWLLRRFGTLLAFQPILLGLILLSRRLWILGGVLVGVGCAVIVVVEVYSHWKTKLPSRRSLSNITQDSLDTFTATARQRNRRDVEGEGVSVVESTPGGPGIRTRGSMASVLEMMSTTLAVMPSPTRSRGPVPLETETLDDLTATERAARTHPDAPPHLPPLSFTDHAEEMAGILYAPELIAPPPIIWLPNDTAGVARSEAYDLQRYHGLRVTLDVRTKDDVIPQRPSSRVRRVS